MSGSSDGPAGRVDDAVPVAVGGHGPGGLQPLRAHARVGRHGAEVLRPGLVLGQGLVQDGAGSGGDELLALVQRACDVGVGRRRGGGDEAGDEPSLSAGGGMGLAGLGDTACQVGGRVSLVEGLGAGQGRQHRVDVQAGPVAAAQLLGQGITVVVGQEPVGLAGQETGQGVLPSPGGLPGRDR